MASYENPWLYNGIPFESSDIGKAYGFVYLLEDLHNGKKYIGRKYLWSVRLMTSKEKKSSKGNRKRIKKESDWKEYYSSSKQVQKLVEEFGTHRFRRTILSLHDTKGQVNYHETKQQFKQDVLEALHEDGTRLYYNDNILARYFAPK